MSDYQKPDFGAEWQPVIDPYWSAIPDDAKPSGNDGIRPAEYAPSDLRRGQPCAVPALMEYSALRLPVRAPKRNA